MLTRKASVQSRFSKLCYVVILSMLLNLVAIVSPFANGRASAAEQAATLAADSVSGDPGEVVVVPVNLTSSGEVDALQFDLSYDHNLLTYQSRLKGDLLTESHTVGFNQLAEDKLRVLIYSLNMTAITAGSGAVIELSFQVAAGAQAGQTSPLELNRVMLSDSNGQAIPPTVNSGQFRVKGVSPLQPPVLPADGTDNTVTSGGGGANTVQSVSLTSPASGQSYQPGEEVTISGTAQNLSGVSVDVAGPDGRKLLNAKSLDSSSGSFTTKLALGSDAADGNYTITISGTGLTSPVLGTFTVKAAAESAPAYNSGNPASTNTGGGAPSFNDLNNHWAQKEITDLVARGLLKGMTPTEFMPDADTTRAQFVAMLVRLLNISPQAGADPVFKDVPPGSWYHDTVSAAVGAGLASGYRSDRFGPDDLITREQMASMIVRALLLRQELARPNQAEIAAILEEFQDRGSISAWAKNDLALAVQLGIIRGRSGGVLAPQAHATRAEAAVVICRLSDLIEKAGTGII